MRRFKVSIFCLSVLAALGGCASVIPFGEKSVPTIASVLGVSSTNIEDRRRCTAGYARPNVVKVATVDCLLISSDAWVALVGYDFDRKTYKPLLLLDRRVAGVAIASYKTALGTFEQIQVQMDDGHVILDVRDSMGMGFGQGEEMRATFERLKVLGIPEVQPRSYVQAIVDTGPTPIYIYMPR